MYALIDFYGYDPFNQILCGDGIEDVEYEDLSNEPTADRWID